jgi:23S rRNA (uracil1939-C5)-methyltransferase
MVEFLIDHLDPLGQGVSRRIDDKKKSIITFIPKTLPGEQGSAKVIKSSKGVEFAALDELRKKSHQRIDPECPHYARCSGCDYQHVSYDDELAYKKSALLFLLRSIDLGEIQIELIASPNRFSYRNRVQFHYRHKYLGLIDVNENNVMEVPGCRLMSRKVKNEIDKLYVDKNWAEEHIGHGHVEIYEKDDLVSVAWNQPYADGGFTQVNSEMNAQMKGWIRNRFSSVEYSSIVDLFSGDGNLSDTLLLSNDVHRVMVDSYKGDQKSNKNTLFFRQDLYHKDALDQFLIRCKFKNVDILLLDPPRKGFSALTEWYKKLMPKYLIYISCNPATLARDLKDLMQSNKKLKIDKVVLLDMFPATRHFETLVVLER